MQEVNDSLTAVQVLVLGDHLRREGWRLEVMPAFDGFWLSITSGDQKWLTTADKAASLWYVPHPFA